MKFSIKATRLQYHAAWPLVAAALLASVPAHATGIQPLSVLARRGGEFAAGTYACKQQYNPAGYTYKVVEFPSRTQYAWVAGGKSPGAMSVDAATGCIRFNDGKLAQGFEAWYGARADGEPVIILVDTDLAPKADAYDYWVRRTSPAQRCAASCCCLALSNGGLTQARQKPGQAAVIGHEPRTGGGTATRYPRATMHATLSRVGAAALTLIAATTVAGATPLQPNAGTVHGEGTLNDHDRNTGTWQLDAKLGAGQFAGTLAVTLGGKALTVTLKPGAAYFENGFCVVRGESGRSRLELRGKCDTERFGPGTLQGYFDGDRQFVGEFTGTLRTGSPAAPAPPQGAVPTGKLGCVIRERIGGVVAGDLARYEMRPSSMVWLTLQGGIYRTANTSGRYEVQGDRVRLTGGAYAGATGQLRPDNAGEPAVYFEVASNRDGQGMPIVDAWNTSCVRAR